MGITGIMLTRRLYAADVAISTRHLFAEVRSITIFSSLSLARVDRLDAGVFPHKDPVPRIGRVATKALRRAGVHAYGRGRIAGSDNPGAVHEPYETGVIVPVHGA